MKIEQFRKIAEPFKSTEVYDIFDYKKLQNLIISVTELKPGQNTSGHSHDDSDEVYICLDGYDGQIQVGENLCDFDRDDFIIIPRGSFHKVWNNNEKSTLKFLCIFEKYGDRK